MQNHTLHIPDICPRCGFPNFNVIGLRQNSETTIKVTCMRCGAPSIKPI